LYEALGIAAYLLLVNWFVLVVLLWLRRTWLRWSLRLLGCLLLLPCAAVLADWLGPVLPGEPLPLGGGILGAWLMLQMQASLSQAGFGLVLVFGLVLGLVLVLDIVLLQSLRFSWRAVRWLTAALWRIFCWWTGFPWWRRSPAALPVSHSSKPTSSPSRESETLPSRPSATACHRAIPIRHHDQVAADHGDLESGRELSLGKVSRPSVPDMDRFAGYELPALSLLEDPQPFPHDVHDQHLREMAAQLEKTFADFSLKVRVVGINTGPVITQYEVALETGLSVHKVTRLTDDLALNLKVPSVRMVAPIPGKNTVGIEVPNEHRAVVRLKEVLLGAAKKASRMRLPLFLGKDTEGRPLVHDLADMPHLLIAGRTGTGKSVCLNAIILSMLMTRRPDEVKMIMIDPKRVELSDYARLPHLMHPIVTDMMKAEAILGWAVDKMEERYDLLSRARVRNISGYNELSRDEILRRIAPADEEEAAGLPERMPYIVIFVDELSDLIMMLRKDVEGHIIRLAQKSRAAGIHLVVATQKPTVDVITGLIKSNLPARICFQVSSRSDSRVVLDEMGADKLLGKGDMLFLQPGTSTLVRAQGTYLDDREIQQVVQTLDSEPCYAEELIRLKADGADGEGGLLGALRARDDNMYESAIEVVIREGRGSVSLLQRTLGIGYGRAARLIDYMAEDGIVGSYNGSSAREVLFTPEQWDHLKAG
jgi:S-DNA-T family DNA segregation ATPase FtsK/SpoIIIE